jgi:hypothetical protein
MRLQAGLFRAPHHGTQKDSFEFAAVVGEMAMRLAKDGNDLRHLKTKRPILIGERGPMALRFMLLPFGRVPAWCTDQRLRRSNPYPVWDQAMRT